ncbi:MAG TPA: SGNH/GDSL hydrolase family protein [Gemmatimonadaceae bacterium]|nr:SGNH/GDSL hydrolase family protein [Gemmatimonadaceae bacterium]
MARFVNTRRAVSFVAIAATAACSDAIPTSPSASASSAAFTTEALSEGRGVFQRYVALGTSVSMGFRSDGVLAESQTSSWPAQLARMAHREMTLPLIDGFGCQAPLRAPLASGARISGESAAAPRGSLACAGNVPGVLPAQNVAIVAATTRDALFTTPETTTDPNNGPAYARVLAPGQTQLSAALAQNPKIVSVELGANEVLGSRNGVAVPGVSLFPVFAWAPLYTRLVDELAAVAKHGVLVGLINDVASFPGMRRGAELYADRAMFAAAFHVEVAADCDASDNLLFVPIRVPVAVGTGLARRNAGATPFVLSCAGAPSATTEDYVLTPAEQAIINTQLAQMNSYIRSEAQRIGWAHAELETLYGVANVKATYSVVQQMTSATPYGALFSLDGMHPSAQGSQVIADAVARALDARYGFGIRSQLVASAR